MAQRHRNAIAAQGGACNPRPIIRSLKDGLDELLLENPKAGTQEILEDPALRMIAHQLGHLLNLREIDSSCGVYDRLITECEKKQDELGLHTFTAFCQEASGQGTTWIEAIQIERNDINLAKEVAVQKCAEAWGWDPSDVRCLGIAQGNINIQFWRDLAEGAEV